MRLLKCLPGSGFELTSFDDEHPPPYAILSHTWTEGHEVTYNELLAGTGTHKSGYDKLRFCGERAAADGLTYFWVDTCCIDKTTNNELSTAINSMFRWYQRAEKCYVYLTDVSVPDEVDNVEAHRISWEQPFRRSRWFTRGWTLQELLAPASVEFFSREGTRLGSRISLEREIYEITRISIDALRGRKLNECSVEERMTWAAGRTTTLKEDKVYCLLGIFGVCLPLIYGEGEEYAATRLKEEIHKRQQGHLTTNLQHFPVSSPLPFARNELFVGRETQLQTIRQKLLTLSSHQRMTIYGLGGCGKSALVLEFAYRALAERVIDFVFWVPAISRESFDAAYYEIATCLRLPGVADPNTVTNKLVKDALSGDGLGSWLMVVDNADDPAVLLGPVGDDPRLPRLADYIPHSRRGAVLFTTRSRKAATTLTPGRMLELKDMSQNEATELLKQHISEQALLDDSIAVNQLLGILTYLPLAIVQAAAFINNNNTSISDYVSLFEHAGAEIELFSEQFEDLSRYQEMDSTIAKTWYISFDQIRKQDPLAAECLSFIACVDRISIPQSLLPLRGSVVQQTKVLGTLTGYAFITERQQTVQGVDVERFFDMHRLVHMASITWLQEQGEWTSQVQAAVGRLGDLVPWGGHEGKDVWAAYLLHAIRAAGHANTVEETFKASLLDRVGRCQDDLGQYGVAEVSYRQALSLRTEALGRKHPDTLMSMSNVALVLNSLGKYKEAEAVNRETLALRKEVLGHKHPDTLISTSNLALVLEGQGKYTEAEAIYRQTLALSNEVLGCEHLNALTIMSNLAVVLNSQGKYKEAETINRQTLALYEKVLGRKHPCTLTSISNLALVLERQGKHEEAEIMYRQTLMLKERVLGREHPDTLTSISNLAVVLNSQGKHAEAETMHRQTLALKERVLGREHLDTLISMNNLARVLEEQGKYKEAEMMHRQTLVLYKDVLGDEHLHTLSSMNNLASVLYKQGKHEEAETMHRKTLRLSKEALGCEHPFALTSMSNLALVLNSQGKYKEAEAANRQTLALREQVLGHKHPETVSSMSNLGLVLEGQGKYKEAETIYRQTLVLCKEVLGDEHLHTLSSMNNLASVLYRQDRQEEAEILHRKTLALSEKALGCEHPFALTSLSNLALVLHSQRKYKEAEAANRQTLALREEVLGHKHPETVSSMSNLALVLEGQGKYKEAEIINRQTLVLCKEVLGREHPNTLTSMSNLAITLNRQGKDEEAETMHRQALALKERVLGREHPSTLTSVYSLAYFLTGQRRYAESLSLYERAHAAYQTVLGADHPTTRACHQHYTQAQAHTLAE